MRRGPYHLDTGAAARFDPISCEFRVPPGYWPLHPITTGTDGFSEETFSLPAGDGAECGYQVFSGPRQCSPTRLAVSCSQTGLGLTEIVRRIGNGGSWGLNERWRVNAGTADEFSHNPTFGGAQFEVHGIFPNTVPTSINRLSYFSPPLHYKVTGNGRNKLRIEGAVVPFDFNTFGSEFSGVGLHTNDNQTLALFYKCVQYLSIDWNWRPDIHRHTAWFYSPQDWRFSPGSYAVYSSTLALQDYFFANAGFTDLRRNVTTAFGAEWPGVDVQAMSSFRDFLQYQGVINQFINSVSPDGYTLAWMDGTLDLLFAGMVSSVQSKVSVDSDRCRTHNFVEVLNGRLAGH